MTRKEMEKQGIATPTVADFTAYSSALQDLVDCMPADRQVAYSPSILAHKLARAVKTLGPTIAMRVENQIMHDKAAGNLDRTEGAIIAVLSRHEAEQDEANLADRRRRSALYRAWRPLTTSLCPLPYRTSKDPFSVT